MSNHDGSEIVTEEGFPYGVRCYICKHEILVGERVFSVQGLGDWLTTQGVHKNAWMLVGEECFPQAERSTGMAQELELKITVRTTALDDLGTTVALMLEEDHIDLMDQDGNYVIEVVKLERADGLPLEIEANFLDWCLLNQGLVITAPAKEAARKAYLDARRLK